MPTSGLGFLNKEKEIGINLMPRKLLYLKTRLFLCLKLQSKIPMRANHQNI